MMKNSRVKRVHKVRLKLLTLLMMVAFTVVVGRLFSIQVVNHERYLEAANNQQKWIIDIKADRGRIVDRQGVVLADSRDRYSLYVETCNGLEIDPDKMARLLAPILECDRRSLARTIRKSSGNVRIERKISRQKKEEMEKLGLGGLMFEVEKERYYPYKSLASQVIGYAGVDYVGLAGIEGYRNGDLKGVDGIAILQRDGLGRKRINPDFPSVPPISGNDVMLTIDAHFQEIAENVLDDAMERYGAKNGSIVIVDPYSGEILSLACSPRIDLNSIPNIKSRGDLYAAMRNRVVTDVFEPGSTFKIVTLTSSLEKGLANLDEKIFCENGEYLVQNHLFHDIHEYGWLKVREVIELSSNIGVIKLAERVEKEGLYQTARKFGFGSRTGVNFPGEAEGVLCRLDQWSGLSLASIAIGQEVSVTSLQMVMAYAAVANGGFLMKPIFVKEIRDSEGEVVFESQPELIREVMTKETAERVKEVLVGVVERGTGTKSRVEGFQVAGKTGTAQKTIPGKRGYAPGKYVTTFGGFFPARNPRYAIFVMLDEPERDKWGGESAAPLCRDLIESTIFAYNGFLDETAPEQLDDASPGPEGRYRVMQVGSGERKRSGEESEGNCNPPVYDLNFSRERQTDRTSLHYPFIPDKPVRGKMPDVSGLSMREAIRVLSRKGLEVRVTGMGEVVRQEPAAGENILGRNLCILWGEDD
jgi:cell division protein FtsI/penicillin-binding protein 2